MNEKELSAAQELLDVLSAYRRPDSPNYGLHFVDLPAEVKRKGNVRVLLSILADDGVPPMARQYAAGALGEIGDARAVESLIEALGQSKLRRGAAVALGRMRATEAVVELMG